MQLSRFFVRPWLALLGSAHLIACAAGGGGATHVAGSGGEGNGAAPEGGSGPTSTGGELNFGGRVGIPEQPDARHLNRCDDAGNCSCIAIASIGHEGVWGPCSSDNTIAFQNWLNTQSTARVDNYDTTKPELTPEFLARYDVVILQWMVANGRQNDDGAPWQYSQAEVDAL